MLEKLEIILKKYEKQLVFFDTITLKSNDNYFFITFARAGGQGWSFLEKEIPIDDLPKVVERYRRKI